MKTTEILGQSEPVSKCQCKRATFTKACAVNTTYDAAQLDLQFNLEFSKNKLYGISV
jgi:hypothetical protein